MNCEKFAINYDFTQRKMALPRKHLFQIKLTIVRNGNFKILLYNKSTARQKYHLCWNIDFSIFFIIFFIKEELRKRIDRSLSTRYSRNLFLRQSVHTKCAIAFKCTLAYV